MSRNPLPALPWRRLPADLAPAMRPALEANVRAVADAVKAATPALAQLSGPKVERDVRTAVQVALERFLDLAGTAEAALTPHVREVFVGLGAAEAREGRGPEALLAALRAAARMLLRAASQALAAVRPVGTAELIDLSDAITAYVDELVSASTDGFTLQLREMVGEGDRRRRRLAELLLGGGAPPSVARAAAVGAGWPSLEAVVPVVLPPDQAREARFRFAADGVVIERERDAVLLLRAGPRATRAQLAQSLRGRAAVVGPALGWEQAPEAVRLAALTAELVHPGPEPVFAEDHLAALALHGEPGALAVLSARRLTAFAALRDSERERLLQTLHSWLLHWGSRAEVSGELFVHPQTVSYRLKRLRDLLGDDLDSPGTRFELLLVLATRARPPTTGPAPPP